jgi:hypothetical protein
MSTVLTLFSPHSFVTELQISWNHLEGIDSINTTGQIIPLCIGALSLIRAVYLQAKANYKSHGGPGEPDSTENEISEEDK